MNKRVQAAQKNASTAFAVIDIGSSSIRMTIAAIDKSGNAHPLEFLQQSLSLGRDTFTKGSIAKNTIGDCVRVLRNFRRVTEEYGITHDDRIRAVATTAVREALNREAFIDRIYIATGFRVEVLNNADVTRLTYLSMRSLGTADPALARGRCVVCEIGGGSTELIVLQNGNIVSTLSLKLGTLRLREMLDNFNAQASQMRSLMESEIKRTIEQIVHAIPKGQVSHLVAIGSDVRFAASQIVDNWKPDTFADVPCAKLEKLTTTLLSLSVNECVNAYHLSYPDAETIAPGLLFYAMLAKRLALKNIVASDISMRHGILVDMTKSGSADEDFRRQIIRSAWEIAKKYQADEAHAKNVASLCATLFTNLTDEHQLESWYGLLLFTAAILHDTGIFVSTRSHHKHSMYIIQNSELFGLSQRDIFIVSLIARYHRKASPKIIHPEYASLDREGRLAVAKLAAILRIADSLDRSHSQRIDAITCRMEKDMLYIGVSGIDDLTLEELGINNKGDMFEEVYGLNVALEKK